MAKNWTLKEAVVEITKGTNKEAIQELGKKFPLTSIAIAKMGSNAGIETLFGGMPEHMTMLKMERSLKEGVSETADEDEDVDTTSEAVEDASDDAAGDVDYNTMTTKQLYEMCIKKGLKVNKYGKPKSYYIEQLTGAVEDAVEDEDDEQAEVEGPDYSTMSAVELFKLCKKRGIKAEPKKKASVYVALLQKADEASKEVVDEEEDDDWDEDDDEQVEEKSTKKAPEKKQPAKKESKPAKKAEPEDDEEDWDI